MDRRCENYGLLQVRRDGSMKIWSGDCCCLKNIDCAGVNLGTVMHFALHFESFVNFMNNLLRECGSKPKCFFQEKGFFLQVKSFLEYFAGINESRLKLFHLHLMGTVMTMQGIDNTCRSYNATCSKAHPDNSFEKFTHVNGDCVPKSNVVPHWLGFRSVTLSANVQIEANGSAF